MENPLAENAGDAIVRYETDNDEGDPNLIEGMQAVILTDEDTGLLDEMMIKLKKMNENKIIIRLMGKLLCYQNKRLKKKKMLNQAMWKEQIE